MPETRRRSLLRRLLDLVARGAITLGLPPGDLYVVTVPGRRTGLARSTPLRLVRERGERWLVAPYGEVGWVRNARAAGRVTLMRRSHRETVKVAEVGPKEGAPVLKRYLASVPIAIMRQNFDVGPDAGLEALALEVPGHPVFKLIAVGMEPSE